MPTETSPAAIPGSYSLSEAAALICGDSLKDPEDWLVRKIRAGKIPGYKVGRAWRMTSADVEAGIEALKLASQSALAPAHPIHARHTG